jgi:hypothetical protein
MKGRRPSSIRLPAALLLGAGNFWVGLSRAVCSAGLRYEFHGESRCAYVDEARTSSRIDRGQLPDRQRLADWRCYFRQPRFF